MLLRFHPLFKVSFIASVHFIQKRRRKRLIVNEVQNHACRNSGSCVLLEELHSCVFSLSVIFGLKGCGFGFLRVRSLKKKSKKKNWRVARTKLMASKVQGRILDAWTFTIAGMETNVLTRTQTTKNINGVLIRFLFSIFTWFFEANLDCLDWMSAELQIDPPPPKKPIMTNVHARPYFQIYFIIHGLLPVWNAGARLKTLTCL